MKRKICTCAICRRTIRRQIEWLFVQEPRWLGEYSIRYYGRLGWVPLRFFRHILGRMVLLGILVKSVPDESGPDEYPRYLLARCMVPAQVLAASTEGGDS